MRSQNLRVVGPPVPFGEQPPGSALAEQLRRAVGPHGFNVLDVLPWRDSGWAIRCSSGGAALEVVVSYVSRSREWFIQVYARDSRSHDRSHECTRLAESVHHSLVAFGGFSEFRWATDGDPSTCRTCDFPQLPRPASKAPITFPVLAISEGESFLVLPSLPDAGTTTAILNGYFQRLILFDSSGLLWRVLFAEPSRPIRLLDRILSRTISVELFLAEPQTNRLALVAESLCALVNADADDLYAHGLPIDELNAKFRSAATPSALIHAAQTLGRDDL